MAAESEREAIEIRLLLEAIYLRYGYDLRGYQMSSLRRRVLVALAKSGLSHLGELQHKLLCEPEFFAHVLEALTVRVTDMFRDAEFYSAYRSRLMPILRTYPLLRIWHAGCATGEEVYSDAIVLEEEGLSERVQIYATDLSSIAIEHARERVYASDRLAHFDQNYQRAGGKHDFMRYCTEAYDGFALRESLAKNVLFFQHNLVSDHVFGEMQVIFCRNVLIYFDQALRAEVIGKLSESLCPGGFLCLGSAERIDGFREGQPFSEFDRALHIYRKVG